MGICCLLVSFGWFHLVPRSLMAKLVWLHGMHACLTTHVALKVGGEWSALCADQQPSSKRQTTSVNEPTDRILMHTFRRTHPAHNVYAWLGQPPAQIEVVGCSRLLIKQRTAVCSYCQCASKAGGALRTIRWRNLLNFYTTPACPQLKFIPGRWRPSHRVTTQSTHTYTVNCETQNLCGFQHCVCVWMKAATTSELMPRHWATERGEFRVGEPK